MIRRLKEGDRRAAVDFLNREPEMNLYLLSDIRNYGFNGEHRDVYGEFKDGRLRAVAGRNRSQITYYCEDRAFNDAWVDVFNRHEFLFLSAKTDLMQDIKPHYPGVHEDRMDFMKTTSFTPDETIDYSDVRVLSTKEEAGAVYDMLKTIEELYTVHKRSKSEFIDYLYDNSGGNGTTVYIERDGFIVASASAVFESDHSAMIVAVATRKAYRKMGYGKKVLHYLMDLYVNQKGKTLCLYYDDPRAENLYKQLGFTDIGRWSMLVMDT